MTTLQFITLIVTILLLDDGYCKASRNSGTRVLETSTKTLYLSSNANYYEASEDDCEKLYGGTLVSIESADDLMKINVLLRPGSVTSIWTGAENTCGNLQDFEPECWHWPGNASAIPETVVSWHSSTFAKEQNLNSRAYFDRLVSALNIGDHTETRRYVCQRVRSEQC